MFERILIKSGSNDAEHFLSIADLVDMMFYYGELHIVVSQFELKQLLTVFGENVLYELITTGRLIVHPCDQHIGALRYENFDSVGLFSHNFQSIDKLLFNFHRETVDDPKENKRFAEKFSAVLNEYRYPTEVNDSLYKDVENEDLLSRVTQMFIRQYYSSYQNIENIQIKATKAVSSFMTFYKIDGNLRMYELNTIHQKLGYRGGFTYSTPLIALGETNVDCYLAFELQAEIIANRRCTEVYKLRMNECIKLAEGSQENIDHFHEMTANDFLSPGESFVAGLITPQELLNDLNCSDSVKFREWLSKIPAGQPLTGELYKDIQGKISNKNWVKGVRSLSQIATGFIHPIAGAVHTFLDSFVGDRLVNGWRPSMFISSVLTKDSMKK